MSVTKELSDKKVNFEFNKEFINLFNKKIKENDTNFLDKTLKELHPADSADIIENLIPENRSKLIELESFKLDPEIFIELNESIQSEIFILLSTESIVNILRRLESDNALKIIENLDEKKKNTVLDKLPPKDRFLLQEGLSYPEDSAARIMQREFTAIPSNWSVGQTIDYLRENKDLPDEFLEIFIVAPNRLIHQVARNAVNKFSNSQLNLLLVLVNTPSVISSSPTPASLNVSSSASSFKTVKTSS